MFLYLFKFLMQQGTKVPAAFFFSSTRMLLAALTTLLWCILLGPFFIKLLYKLKTGQTIRVEDCPPLAELHKKKRNIPTMGGLLILSGMLFALFLWMDLSHPFVWILALTTVWFGGIGIIDDYLKMKKKNARGLRSRYKFFLQIIFASCFAIYFLASPTAEQTKLGGKSPIAKEQVITSPGESQIVTLTSTEYMTRYYLPFLKKPLFILSGAGLILAFLITLVTISGASNAVNLTDGLDGLASGCLVMVASVFAIVAFLSNNLEISKYLHLLYIEGSGEIAIYLSALIGACLGFLWYNGYPAQVFMGDTGSLALGAIIGVSAVMLRREFLLALAGGIFVIEALSVILQIASMRLRNRKRLFLCSPLHHHFEYKGWPETKIVIRFWVISLILAILSLCSIKMQ